jgi:nitric oxide reductase subunit B
VVTPSMRATAKYFWVVLALFLVQILLGAITAHYQVEGQDFYGFALSEILPYSLTRTWHTQLAVLWIATAWLGTGLYIAPALSGHEPKFQRLGVNFLFVCLLIIVVGAFTGQWFAVMQKLGLEHNFWFGHQGWEYADIGRFWQWFLFIGLMLWLTLVGRALWPALTRPKARQVDHRAAVPVDGGDRRVLRAGLMWGEHTHLSMVEYWRWWLVHLWVEGFFEVFATAVIAFLFTKLGLLRASTATVAVLFATIVFMAGGVLGTLHHLYFTGTPTAVIALGASFSRWKWCRWPTSASRPTTPGSWAGPRRGWRATSGRSVLHRGVVLEPGGRRPVRLPDQPAAVAVLHAGPEPDPAARPHRAVRRVRHARHRLMLFCLRGLKPRQSGTRSPEAGRSGRSTSAWR